MVGSDMVNNVKDNKVNVKVENKFQILMNESNEVEEGEVMDQHVGNKPIDSRMIDGNANEQLIDEVSKCNLVKIKLAKELRSLGLVEPEHRKKRRDGKGNSTGGDCSPSVD
ncbi:hypothetical protein KFK09_014836 [Dendrobium nobile]|uniref:Uncharacterized protein n=1 Tax=Dendrobium nobile TaxID=94219 RepID=A0A8T3B470_DENNO|nr:hypothetical protein KFK09_014836 [Dendrobium nobile]